MFAATKHLILLLCSKLDWQLANYPQTIQRFPALVSVQVGHCGLCSCSYQLKAPLIPWHCRAGAAGGSSTANGSSSSSSAPGESSEDAALTRGVGAAVIDWIAERLADYHAR